MKKRKVNKYEHLTQPQAELDFHNLGKLLPTDIERMLDTFIRESIKKKKERLLIITGKGLHSSEGGPVVKPTVIKSLRSHPRVRTFKEARRDRGGSGAFEVELNV